MSARVGGADVEVGVLRDVLIRAQVTEIVEVARLFRLEHFRRRSSEDLTGGLEEDPGVRNQARHRQASVADALVSANEIGCHERPIRPREHVGVHHVDLAERRTHLARSEQQPAWQRWKRDEPFLERHALVSKRQEEIAPGIRVDDCLKRQLRFLHLESRRWGDLIPAGGAQKVSDHGHVWIEHVGRWCRRRSLRGQRHIWRRRRLRRLSARCRRTQLRFERREPIPVLLLDGVEFFSQRVDFLPQRLRICSLRVGGVWHSTQENHGQTRKPHARSTSHRRLSHCSVCTPTHGCRRRRLNWR